MSGAWFVYDGDHTVSVGGEVDMSNAAELAEALGRAEAGVWVLDCSELEFMDSSGLNVLATTSSRLAKEGGRIRLIGVKNHIARVVTLAGLADWLEP